MSDESDVQPCTTEKMNKKMSTIIIIILLGWRKQYKLWLKVNIENTEHNAMQMDVYDGDVKHTNAYIHEKYNDSA